MCNLTYRILPYLPRGAIREIHTEAPTASWAFGFCQDRAQRSGRIHAATIASHLGLLQHLPSYLAFRQLPLKETKKEEKKIQLSCAGIIH